MPCARMIACDNPHHCLKYGLVVGVGNGLWPRLSVRFCSPHWFMAGSTFMACCEMQSRQSSPRCARAKGKAPIPSERQAIGTFKGTTLTRGDAEQEPIGRVRYSPRAGKSGPFMKECLSNARDFERTVASSVVVSFPERLARVASRLAKRYRSWPNWSKKMPTYVDML